MQITSHAVTCIEIGGWTVSYMTTLCLAQLCSVICSNHSGHTIVRGTCIDDKFVDNLVWKSEGVKSLRRSKNRWDYT